MEYAKKWFHGFLLLNRFLPCSWCLTVPENDWNKDRVTWKERVSLLAVNDEWNSAVYPLQEPRLKIKPSLVLVLIPIQISPFGLFPDL
jgi:hypothetical protein